MRNHFHVINRANVYGPEIGAAAKQYQVAIAAGDPIKDLPHEAIGVRLRSDRRVLLEALTYQMERSHDTSSLRIETGRSHM
jgi:hypothetical protein